MKRAVLLGLLLVLADCEFAQKHPAVTIGVTTGVLGWGGCEMAVAKIGTCTAIGGAAGLVLGGITALVYAVTDAESHELTNDEDEAPLPPGTPPPPGLPPGMTPPGVTPPPPPGVTQPPPSADAGAGAAFVDAGVPASSLDAGSR